MEILQRIFIMALKPFECLTKDMPQRAKEIVICICFSLIFVMVFFRKKDFPIFLMMDNNERCEFGCCLLFIIIIMSIKDKLKIVKPCNLLAYLWVTCGIIIMLISFIHPVGNGFRGLSVLMVAGFPCLYFVWQNRGDYDKLYELMAKVIAYAGGIYFAFCVVFVPFYTSYLYGGYRGLTFNTNFLGMVCTVVICMIFYLILIEPERWKRYVMIGAVAHMYLAMTESRTSLLAAVMATVIFVMFFFKIYAVKDNDETGKKIRRNRMAMLVGILSIFIISTAIGQPVRDYCIMYYTGVPVAEEIQWQPPVASAGESVEAAPAEPSEALEPSVASTVVKQSVGLDDVDRFSSGRITIWKNYISKWNLLGHNANKRLRIQESRSREWAHNTFLEMSYRTGLFNGLNFLTIEVLTVIYALLLLLRKKYREPHHFMTTCGCIVFFIYANLEISVFPFYSPQVFLFFMAVLPLFFNSEISLRRNGKERELLDEGH